MIAYVVGQLSAEIAYLYPYVLSLDYYFLKLGKHNCLYVIFHTFSTRLMITMTGYIFVIHFIHR